MSQRAQFFTHLACGFANRFRTAQTKPHGTCLSLVNESGSDYLERDLSTDLVRGCTGIFNSCDNSLFDQWQTVAGTNLSDFSGREPAFTTSESSGNNGRSF